MSEVKLSHHAAAAATAVQRITGIYAFGDQRFGEIAQAAIDSATAELRRELEEVRRERDELQDSVNNLQDHVDNLQDHLNHLLTSE